MGKWWTAAAIVIAAVLVFAAWPSPEPEIPRAVLEKRYATPPSQFVVLGDGTRIHYRDRGPRDAPAILLLHGFSGSLFVWETWSITLSDRFRVVAFDLPGNGLTGPVPSGDYSQGAMTDTVRQFAAKLGLKKFALAGNSMGGGVAARFAENYPDSVTALILIDAAGARIASGPRLHLLYYGAHIPGLNRIVLSKAIDPNDHFRQMAGMSTALLAHFRLPDDPYVWDHVKAIRAPTLILWGANDRLIPLAAAHAWQDAIKGAKLIVYADAGHVAMADAPDRSIKDARAFLDGARVAAHP